MSQYVCISGVYIDIVTLLKLATINISFFVKIIAAVDKTVAICKL